MLCLNACSRILLVTVRAQSKQMGYSCVSQHGKHEATGEGWATDIRERPKSEKRRVTEGRGGDRLKEGKCHRHGYGVRTHESEIALKRFG